MLNANTYVTSQKGIGGTIRNQYEDFYVEEIPEIIPEGEGQLIMRFEPDSYQLGENISRASSITLILLLLLSLGAALMRL